MNNVSLLVYKYSVMTCWDQRRRLEHSESAFFVLLPTPPSLGMIVHRMAKGYYGSKFATEVAPPELVSVVKRKAAKVLDTIEEEEELELMEDLSGTWEITPAGIDREGL